MDEEESYLKLNIKALIDECGDKELLYLIQSLLTTNKEDAII